MKGLDRCYHLSRSYLQEINDGGFDECFDCPFRPDGEDTCDTLEPLFEATIELLKAEEAKPLRCVHPDPALCRGKGCYKP